MSINKDATPKNNSWNAWDFSRFFHEAFFKTRLKNYGSYLMRLQATLLFRHALRKGKHRQENSANHDTNNYKHKQLLMAHVFIHGKFPQSAESNRFAFLDFMDQLYHAFILNSYHQIHDYVSFSFAKLILIVCAVFWGIPKPINSSTLASDSRFKEPKLRNSFVRVLGPTPLIRSSLEESEFLLCTCLWKEIANRCTSSWMRCSR